MSQQQSSNWIKLVFDVTDPKIQQRFNKDNKPDSRSDVRKITKLVADFMQTEQEGSGDNARFVPPGVRFKWGTFRFDGVVDKITEKIDFFSEQGVALRATLNVSITKQDVDINFVAPAADALGNEAPGTAEKPAAGANTSMPEALAGAGNPEAWHGDALANGIENPRDLPIGQPLSLGTDLAAGINAGISASAGVGISAGMGGGIGGYFRQRRCGRWAWTRRRWRTGRRPGCRRGRRWRDRDRGWTWPRRLGRWRCRLRCWSRQRH